MVLVCLLNVYYCVIVGWAIFYLIVSIATIPNLPWDTCGKDCTHSYHSVKLFSPFQMLGGVLRFPFPQRVSLYLILFRIV